MIEVAMFFMGFVPMAAVLTAMAMAYYGTVSEFEFMDVVTILFISGAIGALCAFCWHLSEAGR